MYRNILFPVDVSQDSSWDIALPVILELMRVFQPKLHVLTVIPDLGGSLVAQFFPENAEEALIQEATKKLHAFTDAHIPKDVQIRHVITQGVVYEAIIDTAERVAADLIVMAAHRPELRDYLLGPNAARVVRHSPRSVLVVREPKEKSSS